MKTQSDIRQAVSDQIIQALQEGNLPPWRRSWIDDPNAPGLHTSLSTGLPYRGINQLILQIASLRRGYKSKWWGTFNQVRFHNASVKKGEKAHHIVLWKPISRNRVNRQGDEIDETFLVMREYAIFNVEQTTGLEPFRVGYSQPSSTVAERYEQADHLIEATGARIVFGGNQPCYRPHEDLIEMPFPHQFQVAVSYYETALHELIHWTERADRVGRVDNHQYALGELVAEIGACLLLSELNIPTPDISNSASYIQGWLRGLRNDSRFIFKAAAQANKAADYILSFSRTTVEQQEPLIVI